MSRLNDRRVEKFDMTTPFNPMEVHEALRALRAFAIPDEAALRELRENTRILRRLLDELHAAQVHLKQLERAIDHVFVPTFVFDLTNPETIGEVIVFKLEQQRKMELSLIQPFYGSGVYILYYHGEKSTYEAITNTECPIYVGSAGSENPNADTPKQQGTKLHGRIMEHLKNSISKSRNLKPEDFQCRYLVVQSGLEKAAEDFLIRRYAPVWNKESKVCSGIGKHGDRARQELSDWDVMHGERGWAKAQTSRSKKTESIVEAKIQEHFRQLLAKDRPKWERIFNASWVEKQP